MCLCAGRFLNNEKAHQYSAHDRSRTCDTEIRSHLLYPLSYAGAKYIVAHIDDEIEDDEIEGGAIGDSYEHPDAFLVGKSIFRLSSGRDGKITSITTPQAKDESCLRK